MKNLQAIADKTAVSLSLVCTVHCLAVPFLVVSLPAIAAMNLDDEAFHLWMVVAVIPISLFALTLGCNKHKSFGVLSLGVLGLLVLVASGLLGHDLLGEAGEKLFTVIGASLIAAGHLLNHRLCQRAHCECHG